MGIKENFTQAVKELTGLGGKDKPAGVPAADAVEGLKKAVEDGSATAPREIKLDTPDWSVPDWDGSEASTVRPIPKQGIRQDPDADGSTPAAEQFLSGGSVPVSLFGQQQNQPQAAQQPPPQQNYQQTPQQQQQQSQSGFLGQGAAQSQASQSQGQPQQQTQQQQSAQTQQQQQSRPRQTSFSPAPPSTALSSSRVTGIRDDNELTIISRNTVIDGNIRSFADMSVDGAVKGDIETTKNIDLNGTIVGNISCNNAMMHSSQIQGNVRMNGNISMKRDTLLIGDLMSTYAEINGKIKGNLDVVGKADLKGDAVVFGDISASTVAIEDGAIIQGYLNTTFLNKEESNRLFPDAVVIKSENSLNEQ